MLREGRLNVVVLMGGIGGEREVSLASGSAVAEALAHAGCNFMTSDITPDDLSALNMKGIDAYFIALHGKFGEDGGLQQIMEDRGLVYTGSGPQASRLAMDKMASKRLFDGAGVAAAPAVAYTGDDNIVEEVAGLAEGGAKLVVKPVTGGSTVGVSITSDAATAVAAAAQCYSEFGDCMIERFVAGREITVGILHGRPLPIIEIRCKDSFYDYNAKYVDDSTQYLFDTIDDAALAGRIKEAAATCFNVLGCRDYARMDFILSEDSVPIALEMNTIPGFTSHSLLPKAAAKTGIPMPRLCKDIVQSALERK